MSLPCVVWERSVLLPVTTWWNVTLSASYECQKQQQLPGLKCAADALLGAERSASVTPPAHSSGRTLRRLPNSLVAKHCVCIWPLNAFRRFVLFCCYFLNTYIALFKTTFCRRVSKYSGSHLYCYFTDYVRNPRFRGAVGLA